MDVGDYQRNIKKNLTYFQRGALPDNTVSLPVTALR